MDIRCIFQFGIDSLHLYCQRMQSIGLLYDLLNQLECHDECTFITNRSDFEDTSLQQQDDVQQ